MDSSDSTLCEENEFYIAILNHFNTVVTEDKESLDIRVKDFSVAIAEVYVARLLDERNFLSRLSGAFGKDEIQQLDVCKLYKQYLKYFKDIKLTIKDIIVNDSDSDDVSKKRKTSKAPFKQTKYQKRKRCEMSPAKPEESDKEEEENIMPALEESSEDSADDSIVGPEINCDLDELMASLSTIPPISDEVGALDRDAFLPEFENQTSPEIIKIDSSKGDNTPVASSSDSEGTGSENEQEEVTLNQVLKFVKKFKRAHDKDMRKINNTINSLNIQFKILLTALDTKKTNERFEYQQTNQPLRYVPPAPSQGPTNVLSFDRLRTMPESRIGGVERVSGEL